ncbi:Unknown protein [Striga hermonthica]|uniref:Syntaxin N-terminal domain-containing protein n=1 Tax=Striga hermonthica TaxID=68872 RepID=A0A9N7NGA8_STRHE|nr:Unknown protein [Striga hermonthica]
MLTLICRLLCSVGPSEGFGFGGRAQMRGSSGSGRGAELIEGEAGCTDLGPGRVFASSDVPLSSAGRDRDSALAEQHRILLRPSVFGKVSSGQPQTTSTRHPCSVAADKLKLRHSGSLDVFFDQLEAIKDKIAARRPSTAACSPPNSQHLRRFQGPLVGNSHLIKSRFKSLDWTNVVGRHLPRFSLGSSSDRTRTFVVDGIQRKLHESMAWFNDLWEIIGAEYGETVWRKILYLERRQRRGEVVEVTTELWERHVEAVKLER